MAVSKYHQSCACHSTAALFKAICTGVLGYYMSVIFFLALMCFIEPPLSGFTYS